MNDFLVILNALTIGISCALLGVFLILKKNVMIGDAISHSVLPGIVLAYIVTTNFNSVFMLIGAAVFGVFTTLIIEFLYKKLKLQEDASIGITFTWLFAVGVIMISMFTESNTDLDQECVLYGDLGTTFLEKIYIGKYLVGTHSFWKIFPVFVLIILTYLFGFKGLKIISFNVDYAISKGINVNAWNIAFMTLVSLTTVMSFESVGAVLVIGFIVLPGATAYLISNKLLMMIYLSVAIVISTVLIGFLASIYFDVNIGSSIVVVNGFLFFLVMLGKRLMLKLKIKN